MSEHVTSAPAIGVEQQQVQLSTESSSSVEIGLDNPVTPKIFNLGIEFQVLMKQSDIDKVVVDYKSKHEMQFSLIDWTGFTDWMKMPGQAAIPYIAMLHDIAIRRAESTLHEMGFRGVALPRPVTFDTDEEIVASTT